MALVWSINLLVGAGFLALGVAMLSRPGRVWVGFRLVRDAEGEARVRRVNRGVAPWLLLLGAAEALSGPVALLAGISPLVLAFAGLAVLLLAMLTLAMAAVVAAR